jgi:hypothetical protein
MTLSQGQVATEIAAAAFKDGEGEATIFRPAASGDRGALPIVVLAYGISGVKSHPRVEIPALLSLYQAGRLRGTRT